MNTLGDPTRSQELHAERRARGARRSAALGLLIAGAAGLIWLGHPHASGRAGALPPAPGRPRPDPRSPTILRMLASQAERAPRTTGMVSNRRARVLTRVVNGKVWRLAEHEDSRSICWVLLVPNVSREGTCGPRRRVLASTIILYMGGEPDPARSRRWTSFVVYGRSSARVRSLKVVLSDCSVTSVALSSRPLFWAFLPAAKLKAGVLPRGFAATMVGGRSVHGRLLNVRRARACLAGAPATTRAASARARTRRRTARPRTDGRASWSPHRRTRAKT
jgi:hypothetical protein